MSDTNTFPRGLLTREQYCVKLRYEPAKLVPYMPRVSRVLFFCLMYFCLGCSRALCSLLPHLPHALKIVNFPEQLTNQKSVLKKPRKAWEHKSTKVDIGN